MVENLGKFHLMRDLASRCILNALRRKACGDLTISGKLLSRLDGAANRPLTWTYMNGRPGKSFARRILKPAEGEECQMY